ncbi:MAG: hypothetical protein HYZ13_09185 [Acidobacteria bacterium]|nr:hypothetical protein [Acidobacteriota bacterium]
MSIRRPALVLACLALAPTLRAGDYDQALSVLSKAFPEIRSVAVFYDGSSTLLNFLEFETSAYKEFRLGIKLFPLEAKDRLTPEKLRLLCTQHRVQAILLLDGDPLVRPSSPFGRLIASQGSRIPVAAVREEWLKEGAWFAIGPSTGGLKVRPKLPNRKVQDTLKELEAEFAKPPSANPSAHP